MRRLIQLTLIAVLFLTLGCQSKEEPETRESRLSAGHRLIDQGQWDEAIAYLKKLEQQDPHLHVKLALASAYAGRAGVRIEKIYAFLTVKALSPFTLAPAVVRAESKTQELMQSLARYVAHWEKIPELQAAGRRDLEQAVKVLQGQNEPGAHLYAATLRVVLLKSVVQEGLRNWDELQDGKICSDEMRPYYDWALLLLQNLAVISEDLSRAFPEKKAEYQKYRDEFLRLNKEAETLPWPQETICF